MLADFKGGSEYWSSIQMVKINLIIQWSVITMVVCWRIFLVCYLHGGLNSRPFVCYLLAGLVKGNGHLNNEQSVYLTTNGPLFRLLYVAVS